MNSYLLSLNTLRPGQDGRHFTDGIFASIFINENCCILIKFSLKYVRKDLMDNNPALVQIMAWRRSGDKPWSEPMMVNLSTHICVTRPQWVSSLVPTHWGWVTHICISKLAIIGSDNGLSPGLWQVIIWNNAAILLTGPLGTSFVEILIEIHTFSFRKMLWKMASEKYRPFCLGRNVF